MPTSQHVVFTHSAAYHQALNPVECAARQLYHLMNYYLECGRLSAISWLDMLLAAAYSMNQLPHPQSRDRKKQVQSAFELIHGRKPDLSLMIAGPGEIVIVDEEGAKASGGAATGSHCIFIHPEEGGFMVRSCRTKRVFNTRAVRRITGPKEFTDALASARLAIQAGMYRDGGGVEGASGAAVASGCLSLLADEARKGGEGTPDDFLVLIDPLTGHPLRLVRARLDGSLILVERAKSLRAGQRRPNEGRHKGSGSGSSTTTSLSPTTPATLAPGTHAPSESSGSRVMSGTSLSSGATPRSRAHPPTSRPAGSLDSRAGQSAQVPAASPGAVPPAQPIRSAPLAPVGTRKWLSKVDLDTPLYFDKAHKKSNLSGERYAKYSSATTVGEYKERNPRAHMANDA